MTEYNTAQIGLLRMIRDSTFITRRQMIQLTNQYGICTQKKTSSNRTRLYSLVQFMAESGDIKVVSAESVKIDKVYAITKLGLSHLESAGYGIASITSSSDSMPDISQSPHALQLVKLRIALSPMTAYWYTDREVASRRITERAPYCKDYDAVAAFNLVNKKDQTSQRVTVAFEYERTYKAASRYQGIASGLRLETKVSRILYVLNGEDYSPVMFKYFDNLVKVGFVQLGELIRQTGSAKVLRSINGKIYSCTFGQFLEETPRR